MQEENPTTSEEAERTPFHRLDHSERDLEQFAREMIAANDALRVSLDAYDLVIKDCLEKYAAGMRLQDVIRMLSPADATVGSNVEVIHVFESRRVFRRALVGSLLIDGMSVDEIAKTFKIPIDSVQDLANELAMPYD